jgi:hypothetical protein
MRNILESFLSKETRLPLVLWISTDKKISLLILTRLWLIWILSLLKLMFKERIVTRLFVVLLILVMFSSMEIKLLDMI